MISTEIREIDFVRTRANSEATDTNAKRRIIQIGARSGGGPRAQLAAPTIDRADPLARRARLTSRCRELEFLDWRNKRHVA